MFVARHITPPDYLYLFVYNCAFITSSLLEFSLGIICFLSFLIISSSTLVFLIFVGLFCHGGDLNARDWQLSRIYLLHVIQMVVRRVGCICINWRWTRFVTGHLSAHDEITAVLAERRCHLLGDDFDFLAMEGGRLIRRLLVLELALQDGIPLLDGNQLVLDLRDLVFLSGEVALDR